MSEHLIQHIQTMQFAQKAEAEALLKEFLRDVYSDKVVSVELRPLAVSLNSFNGFLTVEDGKRLFFKTHTEPDTVIGEYYNANQLADAGYPIIRPIFSSTEVGRQLLIYEIVDQPSVFDLAWSIEGGNDDLFENLKAAQEAGDNHLLELYLSTMKIQTDVEAARSPIHQLFYHRLTGGRLNRFYGEGKPDDTTEIVLPSSSYSMRVVRNLRWVINGQQYDDTIDKIIQRAITVLNPAQSSVSVIGHGDAHNGNIFFQNSNTPSLLYFDPAFAGRHSPLLDLVKPIFHNVFAMWMYFPVIKANTFEIQMRHKDEVLFIEHDYVPHKVRDMFLESKLTNVIIPLMRYLLEHHMLREDWREYLKSALFCCPFLTMNLADSQKFPPKIALLGLTMSVEMGAESHNLRSRIDRTLDRVADDLRLSR